ncbi:pyridoxamine 5'-phosphate oxidase family protein [Streptomyces crystallinus]|uniref:Pyridoxamine 5'-phosphate oxidase family protein n=1 Tax=Streptomyces crystallinus TaxID=68191 RepID=A0ABN1GKW1_9ACTN
MTAPTPYHPGSRAVQDRVGVREVADHVGRAIGPGIRPVAAAFLELQPMLVLGAADEGGRMWASLLTGRPGFVRATGPHQISVTGRPAATDPLAGVLTATGTRVGTLALDPRTRRRMRLNGAARPTPRGLAVEAEQVFSNCPKYLQRRELEAYEKGPGRTGAVRRGERLAPDQEEFVRAADTFFIATTAPDGVDASHRGGNPGFVRVTSPTTLEWRDYPGNSMFLTLGNLEADPRAGLLLVDWAHGGTLQLSGTARTVYAAGERTLRFTLERTVWSEGASPLRWSAPDYSPANPPR